MPARADGTAAVDAYLARVPPRFRAALEAIRATIRSAAPRAEEGLSYGMPVFRQDGDLVYYAAFRDHLSFFPGGVATRRRFARELKPFLGGKGTVRFTLEHPLPLALVRRIVRSRLAENAARRTAKLTPSTRGSPARPSARKGRPARRATSPRT